MDRDYFTNAGMPFPWSSAQNCTSDQSNFFDPNSQFDSSSLTSMVPSSTSDAFILRELIGKLGGGGGAAFPPATHTNNSPPPVPPLPSLSSDPGFAERAAKFSCFGSRSFNGRASPSGGGDHQQGLRSGNPPMANEKLPRVSSSPSLRSQVETGNALLSDKKLPSRLSGSGADSNEESSVSEQIVETGSKNSNELNSRKRKVVSRGKTKEEKSSLVGGVVREEENGNAKRAKQDEAETEKQKTDQKPPEPPKDYIHVRARRGQATDSHSLAERVRREKISERMKLLQDLVPGCNKVTGKALMLDEIINYVQSLQRQVEFLSMKLSSVNPGLDINMENLLSKDVFEQNTTTVAQQMYPIDSSSAPAAIFYHHHHHQQQHNVVQNDDDNTNNINIPSLDHLGLHLPSSLHGFNPQFAAFSEDDLQSIVQMGFANFQVPNHTSNMKIER